MIKSFAKCKASYALIVVISKVPDGPGKAEHIIVQEE